MSTLPPSFMEFDRRSISCYRARLPTARDRHYDNLLRMGDAGGKNELADVEARLATPTLLPPLSTSTSIVAGDNGRMTAW
jgi:hypothetical protein